MSKGKFYRNAYLFLALGILIVVLGFTPSYFIKLGEMSWPYHLHGISASLWMILLVVQPYLYKRGKMKLHRSLGWFSLVLVPLIVIGGVMMMQLMVQRQEFYPPNAVYQLGFIDAVTLPSFALVYALAIYYRKNLKLHARFMVCTIFGPLIPALTRVFFILGLAGSFNESLTYSYLLVELVLFILVVKERKETEMRYTYLPFLAFMIVQHLLMYSAADWDWWVSALNAFAGVLPNS